MKKLYFLISISVLLLSQLIQAQTTKEEYFNDIKNYGGNYSPYNFINTTVTPVPEGYKPFYISHYSRHGSRWIDSPDTYIRPKNILVDAHNANKLTVFGESLYERVLLFANDAEGHSGDLAHLGVIEHKGIAERMFRSFPEVFSTINGRKCYIYSRSTVVPRVILSMAANNERLKELNPEIEISREASKKNTYLANIYKISNKDSVDVVYNDFLKKHFSTDHFLSSLFTDAAYTNEHIQNPITFVDDIYSLAANLNNMDHLNISMFDVFSKDDLFSIWQASNFKYYIYFTSKTAKDSAKILLKNILDCAESAIKDGNVSADLRFGHDIFITPLLALMDIKGMNGQESDPEKLFQVWSDFKVTPMAVNLQLIFYKNDNTGDVIVKLLHCEKEVEIPVTTDISPYYHWNDFRSYYEKKLY